VRHAEQGSQEAQVLAQLSNRSRELRSTQTLVRFVLRTSILVAFAAFGSTGFLPSLAMLLGMSMVFSAVIGTVRREPRCDIVLNHWDETAAYAALFCLVGIFNHAIPI
jgi:hypothetical protein